MFDIETEKSIFRVKFSHIAICLYNIFNIVTQSIEKAMFSLFI